MTLRSRGQLQKPYDVVTGFCNCPVFNRTKMSEIVYAMILGFKTVFLMQNAVCKFTPSCSQYAREAVKKLPLHLAIIKIIWRILRCNPLSKGGFDPV
jgi:putative membrane protein insertion efficiency factor